MKILVTGGAGFIGSHIVDAYVESGHMVTVIDNLSTGFRENINPNAEFIEIDITDPKVVDIICERKFDVINHHAAQMNVRISVDDPVFDAQTNIIGGLRIYEAAVRSNVKKIVFASSGGTVYGELKYFPADENHPLNPISPYGISKLTNEYYLYYYKQVYNLDFVALRYSNVYGPRQNPFGEAGVVAIFTSKMLRGEQPVINGDGTATRDYVYIGDVVRANLIALQKNVTGIFNIGTGKEYDVNYVFRTLKEIIGSNVEEFHGPPKLGELQRNCLYFEKFHRITGWAPTLTFEEGLKETVNYFKKKLV